MTTITCFERRIRSAFAVIAFVVMAVTIYSLGSRIKDSEDKAQKANDRIFRIFHGTPSAIVMCNDYGRIIEFNLAAEELFGWKANEAIGQHVNVLMTPEDVKAHDAAFAKILAVLEASEEPMKATKRHSHGIAVTKDGHRIPIEFSSSGIKYHGGIEFLATIRKQFPNEKEEIKKFELPPKMK